MKPGFINRDLGINHLPEPFEECEASEFLWYLSMYNFDSCEARQVHMRTEDDQLTAKLLMVRIFWFHDCAYAVEIKYDGKATRAKQDAYSIGKVYRCGCNHDWRGIDQTECRERGLYHGGRCYHVKECTKCRVLTGYDSSD